MTHELTLKKASPPLSPTGQPTTPRRAQMYANRAQRQKEQKEKAQAFKRNVIKVIFALSILGLSLAGGYALNYDRVHEVIGCPDLMEKVGLCVQKSSWWPF